MLTCPKCDYENELGRIFCHQCGTKLDLDQIKPPSRGGKSLKKKGAGGSRAVSWTIRLVILGLLAAVVFLIAQVPELEVGPTTANDLQSFYQKRGKIERATYESKPAQVVMTEEELNAFLESMQFEKAKGGGIKVMPTGLAINLEEGQATVTILGEIKVTDTVSKRILISYTGRPVVARGTFTFEPLAGAIGKLPLPRLLLEKTGYIEGHFANVFRNMQSEKAVLGRLSSIVVESDQLILDYQPGAPNAAD